MTAATTSSFFTALSILAVILLWGTYAANGALKENILVVLRGSLGDTALKTDYTGFFPVDFFLSLLVAFFFYSTNGSYEGFQLLVLSGYSTLESAFVWLYAESMRPGQKPWVIATPVFFAFCWQFAGGACALPLYYACHVLWQDGTMQQVGRVRDQNAARALPFSFLLGAIVPGILTFATTWEGPGLRTAETHQRLLAVFQANPTWVALIQGALTYALRCLSSGKGADSAQASRAAHWWIRASYLVAAVSSSAGHIYTALRVFAGTSEDVTVLQMRVPFYPGGLLGGLQPIIARGTLIYLQFDVLIFDFASLAWAFVLVSRLPRRAMSKTTLALLLAVGWVSLGAGGTVSLALYLREGHLPKAEKARRA